MSTPAAATPAPEAVAPSPAPTPASSAPAPMTDKVDGEAEEYPPRFVPTEDHKYDVQVMVYNVAKRNNIGNIVRSAVAFKASTIVIIGNRKVNTFGNQNTNNYIRFVHYNTLDEAIAVFKQREYDIIGIEIGAGAKSVTSEPFTRSTVFMFGQEGAGLSPKQVAACDKLVYIPQFGKGTASLNVSNAAAIVLHRFASWAGYQEQKVEGAKFVVEDDAQVRLRKRPAPGETYSLTPDELAVRAQRQAAKKAAAAGAGAADADADADADTAEGEGEGEGDAE